MPDTGSEGEDALADADPHAFGDSPAMMFEAELVLGGVVDRLDPLADAAELAEPRLLVLAVGAHERGVEGRDDVLELAGKALVGDDDLAAGQQLGVAGSSSIAAATSRSPSLAGARQK